VFIPLERWQVRWATLAVIILLGACSFRFVYRQLDWLVPWRLGDYVTFDSAQRSLLEQRLLQQLDWHCTTQLQAYATWFRELQRAPQPFTRADIERHYRRTTEFWRALMQQLSPDVAALLRSADAQQLDELFTNLEQRNRELDDEYVSADWETVQKRRIERMDEILSRWLGPLEPRQEQAIAHWAKALGQGGKEWIASRRRWQGALREALTLREDPERYAARVTQLLVEPESLWPVAYQHDYLRMRARTLDMLAEVAAQQTPEQVRHLRHELGAWADDFEELACPATGTARAARSDE